jgi:hypothetical protein
MITDKHGYPVELEVRILESVKGSGSYSIHTRKDFTDYIGRNFGKKSLEILSLFWRSRFLCVTKSNFGSQYAKHGFHGTRIELTQKGEVYLSNMNQELQKIKSGGN